MIREPLLQPWAEPLVLFYMRALGYTIALWAFLSGVAEQAEGDCRSAFWAGEGRQDSQGVEVELAGVEDPSG